LDCSAVACTLLSPDLNIISTKGASIPRDITEQKVANNVKKK